MKEVTRRGFIQSASVVGAAAAVGTVASLPAGASATERNTTASPASDVKVHGPAPEDVVVHIRDASTSEVALIAGHEEFVYHDAKLVSSVLSKFDKSSKE